MANAAPATVTITSSTGPGQAVTSLKYTDITKLNFNFGANTVAMEHTTPLGTQYFDYSAMNTVTFTISSGLTTVTISS
jgi:hypothetical protein